MLPAYCLVYDRPRGGMVVDYDRCLSPRQQQRKMTCHTYAHIPSEDRHGELQQSTLCQKHKFNMVCISNANAYMGLQYGDMEGCRPGRGRQQQWAGV